MGSILLHNISIDDKASDILICGERISYVKPSGEVHPQAGEDCEVVDCTGKAALPGFVNMHTHAGMALMRGIGEDIAFHEWLDRIWKVESGIDEEYVYHRCADG